MKTERIVDNPENHGWELVGGKWIWASGRNTGHITDGDLNGETTVWKDNQSAWVPNPRLVFNDGGYAHFTSPVKSDDRFHVAGGGGMTRTPSGGINLYTENNAGQVVLDENGNVGIGTTEPDYALDVRAGDAPGTVQAAFGALSDDRGLLIKTYTNNAANVGVEFDARGLTGVNGQMKFSTNSNPALTIDATGDANFSGTVSAEKVATTGNISSQSPGGYYVQINPEDGGDSPHIRFRGGTGVWYNIGKSATNDKLEIHGGPSFDAPSHSDLMSLDASGNVQFGGTVNGVRSLIGAKDLIETLSTLRASTLDETVDVRQALASACDKLIEKFEAMQDQVSTQDIQE